MTVPEKITALFTAAGIKYELVEHAPVFTSEEAAAVRGSNISMGAKALVFMADKSPILIVVPGDKKLDTKAFKKQFGFKDMSMADPQFVFDHTSVKIGAVPPVGKAIGLTSYFDNIFKSKDKVAFNAGLHTVSIIMNASDLLAIEQPLFGDFVK